MSVPRVAERRQVPIRAIAATIAMVLATALGLVLVTKLTRILTWVVIAAFFAVILNPVVGFLERRLGGRRGIAVLLTFLLGIALAAGILYLFIRPLVEQTNHFVDNFPRYVSDAKAGKGPVGDLVKRYKLDEYVDKNQQKFKDALSSGAKPALGVARVIANTLAALVTIVVLTALMLVEGPKMLDNAVGALPAARRDRVRKVAADCVRSVTGYVAGNLLISLIASAITFVTLTILDVPFASVLALWVFFADLIPLVGATLGAIPAILVALIHSPTDAVIVLVVYIVYQQVENHFLQVSIMAKTVKLNPLVVLVSVLIGVELAGFLGALLAIPFAGVIQVISRDLYDHAWRHKVEPTIGPDEIPLSTVMVDESQP